MDQAGGICSVDLALDHALQYLEDLTAHFSRLGHCELEEQHADISIHLLTLAHTLAGAQGVC